MTLVTVSAAQAMVSIKEAAQIGKCILGLDGFTTVSDGLRAELDLILDISDHVVSPNQAAAVAIAFVQAKNRPDVVWEVTIGR